MIPRNFFSKAILSLLCVSVGPLINATPIASYTMLYASSGSGADEWQLTYGANENFGLNPGGAWDATLLTITPFSNSAWGSTYTLNANNTASFTAFTAMLTDGEEDWVGTRMGTSTGWGAGYTSEPWLFFGAPSSPFGIDLIGYKISEITIQFAEDHTLSDLFHFTPNIEGKYTVSFFGDVANSVPDSGSVSFLLGLAAIGLGIARRSPRTP